MVPKIVFNLIQWLVGRSPFCKLILLDDSLYYDASSALTTWCCYSWETDALQLSSNLGDPEAVSRDGTKIETGVKFLPRPPGFLLFGYLYKA